MPLTNAAVRKATPQCKPTKLSDGRGLYLLLNPNGSRWWRFKYRFEGKEKLLSLGTYPDTGLAEARDKRDAARQMLKRGIDPSTTRRRSASEPPAPEAGTAANFASTAREWMARQTVGPVTASKNRWLLETFLIPHVGLLPLSAITPRRLLEVLRLIEEAGKLETAKRARIKVSQVFRYAMLEGKVDSDPTTCLRGLLKQAKPRHHSAITEPARIGLLLRAIDGYAGHAVTRLALQLAPLVFVRPGELRRARWSEFDLDAALWRIPGERMKMKAAHLVPLSTRAMALLFQLHRQTGAGPLLFPNHRNPDLPLGENTLNSALRRLDFGNHEMTSHGFRSMAATRLNELGWNAAAIERQLAHAESNKVRDAYTHAAQYLDERRRMMQAWSDYLDHLRKGSAAQAHPHPGPGAQHHGGGYSLRLPAFTTTWGGPYPGGAAVRIVSNDE